MIIIGPLILKFFIVLLVYLWLTHNGCTITDFEANTAEHQQQCGATFDTICKFKTISENRVYYTKECTAIELKCIQKCADVARSSDLFLKIINLLCFSLKFIHREVNVITPRYVIVASWISWAKCSCKVYSEKIMFGVEFEFI